MVYHLKPSQIILINFKFGIFSTLLLLVYYTLNNNNNINNNVFIYSSYTQILERNFVCFQSGFLNGKNKHT